MEEQAATLLTALRKSSSPIDAKVALLNNLKSDIKHLRVPEAAQSTIFDCVRLAIGSSTSSSLASAGFSTLGHLLKRLNLQDQTAVIASQSSRLFPILLDRLGDARESLRVAASQALTDLWPVDHVEVERLMRDVALTGTHPRAKEMAMLWVAKMGKEQNLHFRSFVPHLVACLEDADGSVRETAKMSVVQLFKNAPEHAKADLRKQMSNYGVRKTIASFITTQIGSSAPPEPDLKASVMSATTDRSVVDSLFNESVMSEVPPPAEAVPMDPLYVHSQRALEDHFREMHPYFEGKESEHNWLSRDKSITKLRRLTKGNAPTDFHQAFLSSVRGILDGILKVANSLRTTMSTGGCQAVQDMARTLGSGLDNMTEVLLQNFIKMCANTKQISAQNGNVTVDVIISNVSYHQRLLQHMWFACQDKNVQPRTYVPGWLKTILRQHTHNKSHFEHTGGLELLEKCIKKGLSDANPKVREGHRSTYWAFASMWPEKAEVIMSNLDAKSKQLLERDPGNPNAPSLASSMSSSMSSLSKSRIGSSSVRPSVKEAIIAQKKALAARRMPERPSSAQSTFSPMKQPPTSSANPRLNATPSGSGGARLAANGPSNGPATRPALTTQASGSLMSAPMRRPRRPELARPATADPYASRRALRPETPSRSPSNSPQKNTARKPMLKSGSKSQANRVAQSSTRRLSPTTSPAKGNSRLDQIQKAKTPREEKFDVHSPMLSPLEENFTMVMPSGKSLNIEHYPDFSSTHRQHMEPALPEEIELPNPVGDDAFTMVIPNLTNPNSSRDVPSPPAPHRSLSKPNFERFNSPLKTEIVGSEEIPLPTSSLLSRSGELEDDFELSNGNLKADGVKVYEDPRLNGDLEISNQQAEPEKQVLEELPLNEQSLDRVRQNSAASISSQPSRMNANGEVSPSKSNGENLDGITSKTLEQASQASQEQRTDILRNRKLLTSGIERIRNRTLDVHGFRRLQDLIKNNHAFLEIGTAKSSELLQVLLDALENPGTNQIGPANQVGQSATKATLAKSQNLQGQLLSIVRALLTLYRREVSATTFYSQALRAVIKAKARQNPASHLAAETQRTIDEILRCADAALCVDALMDLLGETNAPLSTTTSKPPRSRPAGQQIGNFSSKNEIHTHIQTQAICLDTLTSLTASPSLLLSPQLTRRLGATAVSALGNPEPDVRKPALDLSVELHERLKGGPQPSMFWKAVHGAEERHLNLITYYVARRGRLGMA